MRLLECSDGKFKLTEKLVRDIPSYAILSHTWGLDTEEVTFKDLVDGAKEDKIGYAKIRFCAEQARRDDLQYFWVDTCCIDKSDPIEVQRSINSMFRWYRDATRCYVYLSDVSVSPKRKRQNEQTETISAFRESKWFTRGWTLQELLAPASVDFFTQEGQHLGDKKTLEQHIHEITGITVNALRDNRLSQFDIEERFKWAEKRKTRHEEDWAYCLLGIFGVFMPPNYGEGKDYAVRRLRKEIDEALKHDNRTEPRYGTHNNQKCLECKIISPQLQPSRAISFQEYAADIIPAFFTPGELRRILPVPWPIPWSALRGAVIQAHCLHIKMTLPIGSSYGDIESAFTNLVPGAASEFQLTFPDKVGFRVALVDQCLQLRNCFPTTAKSIDLGLSFLILALIISHPVRCDIAGPDLGPFHFSRDLYVAIHHHAELCISVLLQRTLRKLLLVIQEHVQSPTRDDWLPVCLAISLLLMGAESLQVDIYLSGLEPSKMIRTLEEKAVKNLIGAFVESTNAVNPLTIDWNDERNTELVGSNPDMVYAFQDLQDLREYYFTFLNSRRDMVFTKTNTDCLTGKLVSNLLLVSKEG